MEFNVLRDIYQSSGFGDIATNPGLLVTEWRDLKLKIAFQNDEFEPNIDLIKKKNFFRNTSYWEILKKYKGKSIITGSLALKAFGLLDREVGDIDLIVVDPSIIKYPGNHHDRYSDVCDLKTLIGYDKVFTKNLWVFDRDMWYVDFFENTNQSIIEKDGFLFQNPIEIMNKKIEMVTNRLNTNKGNPFDRQKDFEDFLVFHNTIIEKYNLYEESI